MLVLALAERASDQRTWPWRRSLAPPAVLRDKSPVPSPPRLAEGQPEEGPTDVRPRDVSLQQEAALAAAPVGAFSVPAIDTAWFQGWWTQLGSEARSRCAELVLAGLYDRPSPSEASQEAMDWMHRIAPPEEQGTPGAVLRDALERVAAGQPLPADQRRWLQALRPLMQQALLSQVEDGTAIFRPAERDIWLYALAFCRDRGPEALHRQSLGKVAYMQLDQQPAVYRGHIVTITGRVRRGYRVPALPNLLGITEYAVYWVLTEGGPDAPVVVYALDTPAGFPPLPWLEAQPGGAVLDEPVEISGIFLKRAAYRGQGGVFTAPLLLAHTPGWRPPAPASPPRGEGTALLALATAMLVSLTLVAWVWRRTRRQPSREDAVHPTLVLPPDLEVTPKLDVALHQLEQSAEEPGP